ncbi:MAG: DUF1127 domain-containing protein [Acetobacteraceae bacterium]
MSDRFPTRSTGRSWFRTRALATLAVMLRTARTRAPLREMEPHMLADIGITRSEALAEASRAPWETDPAGARERWSPAAMLRRWQGRRLLRRLDARGLRDLGRSYAELEAEANKPFWRA